MMYFFLFMALMIPLVAVILDSRLGQALAARLERNAGTVSAQPDERTAALEAEVERLADEVRRLREQGEFIERLVAERARPELPAGPRGGTDGGADAAVRPEGGEAPE